ncbi:S66 family peptidase [Paenibacillus antarcticus]|nr:S66 peptidase family protein [Paenibacillus antarcticus]
MMKKPTRLRVGSKIAIISPSSGVPYVFPGIYELGLQNLQDMLGFEIIEMPTARMSPDELYRNPKQRAEDINECFKNDQIDGIITSIGGYESVRILPYLDTEIIKNNPKFIMGFSDATTFLTYFNVLGMVTFYGPSVMAGLAQLQHLPDATTQHLKSILLEDHYPYTYRPFERWTNGYQDWGNSDTLGQCREFHHNEAGWTFIQGDTIEVGYAWGGCIEVLEFMKSTVYWPSESFWNDKILFFETSEEKPTPGQVGYMLRNYGMQGIFQQIKGVMFGRAQDYSNEEKQELNQMLLSVIRDEFGASKIPIVIGVDFGHTDPKLIIPLGGLVQLNPVTGEIVLLESPFA